MLVTGTKIRVIKDTLSRGTATSLKGMTGRVLFAGSVLGSVRVYRIKTDRRTIFGRELYVYPDEIEVVDASE